MADDNSHKPLGEKVKDWFESEGYPLEFRVAQAFEEQGFVSHQGHYVMDESDEQAREIDVVADADVDLKGGAFIRVSHVIECKWSRDKPWVIFTNRQSRLSESACIAQTVGSMLGEAVMFCLAGESSLYALEMFRRPERGGFSGRRAFEKHDQEKYDQFYRAVQGVTSAAVAEARRYDRPKPREFELPLATVIVFPMIVVDTNLFEAYYDPRAGEVRVSEVDRLRIFWRGSRPDSAPISSLDIVTAKVISDFARTRSSEVDGLTAAAEQAVRRVRVAFEARSFEQLEIKRAARGFVGLPALLRELYTLGKTREAPPGSK